MKIKKGILYIGCLMCMLILAGCGANKNQFFEFKEPDKISVVTTIYPMQDFVTQIGGDKVEVINLVPAGVEPHDFELTTGDMGLLEQAQMFIYNGAGMEHFVDKTIDALGNQNLTVVEASKTVATIPGGEEEIDPHTWLSIENAKQECEVICDALCEYDKENEEYYRSNLETYQEKLDDLYKQYEQTLKSCSKDTIVVAHEAFGYLCNEFGLKQEAIEGLTADSEPDSARMKEIIDLCKEEDIKIIFFEELVSPKVAQTIASETGATTMVLNPIEGITEEQKESGSDYISLMQENCKALEQALK